MVKKYLSLVKFSHTIFALPFAFIGFFMGVFVDAQQKNLPMLDVLLQKQMLQLFLLVLVCMVTARSAAMAFNRYLDRHFDAKNPRTAIREIPSGVIAACDGCIEIPQEGMKHSFNISVAAGIVLWEMVRSKQSNI